MSVEPAPTLNDAMYKFFKNAVFEDGKLLISTFKEYEFSDGDEASDPTYFGFLAKDGRWFIKRFTASTNQMRYTKGTSDYFTNWTNRATLTYDYYDIIF